MVSWEFSNNKRSISDILQTDLISLAIKIFGIKQRITKNFHSDEMDFLRYHRRMLEQNLSCIYTETKILKVMGELLRYDCTSKLVRSNPSLCEFYQKGLCCYERKPTTTEKD